MTWDNEAALHDLLAEAEGLDDGYLTVARILPGRREEQLTSREIGPVDELAAAVALAARHLPAGTRVRVRLRLSESSQIECVPHMSLGAQGTEET